MEVIEVTDVKSKAILQYIEELSQTLKVHNINVKIVDWSHLFRKRVDINHYHYSNSTVKVIIPLLLTKKIKNIVTIHDVIPRNKKWKKYISPIIYRILSIKSKYLIVHSKHAYDLLVNNFKFINSQQVKIIPFGLLPVKSISKEYSKYRKEFKINNNELVFIYIGYIKKSKGVFEAVQAVEELNSTNIKFFIIGKPFDEESSIQLKKITDPRIKYLGFLPDAELHKLILAADILINLRQDTVGETSAAVISMLKYGKPILSTDVGSSYEVIHRAGLLCHNTSADIKRAISKYVSASHLRMQLRENAKQRQHELDWNNFIDQYHYLFNN